MKSQKKSIENLSCIEVYELVLSGQLKQFPQYFWQEIGEDETQKLITYFFERKLKWSIEDIKNKIDSYIFPKWKLGGMIQTLFDGSPYKFVSFVYPEIKEWELNSTPLNYWTREKCLEVTKQIIEKENLEPNNINNQLLLNTFKKYKVTTIGHLCSGETYALINTLYPDLFKIWEYQKVPKEYWTLETGKEAVIWLLEKKLKWTDTDIIQKYNYSVYTKNGLAGMLNTIFECSPYKAIDATYPNKYKPEDFNNVPINYWTEEKALIAFKNLLKNLTEEDIKKYVSYNFFRENGLIYPLQMFFRGSPKLVINTIYPEMDFKYKKRRERKNNMKKNKPFRRLTELDVLKIRETYKELQSIQKTADLLQYSKNTVNKYVKDISCKDKHSRECNTAVIQKNLEGHLLKVFKNANEAAKLSGVKVDNINHCLRGRTATAGGFIWSYEK